MTYVEYWKIKFDSHEELTIYWVVEKDSASTGMKLTKRRLRRVTRMSSCRRLEVAMPKVDKGF